MAQTEGDRAAIIRFWSTVEAFSPPPVDKVDRQRRVYALTPDEPLPWQPGHELASERLRRGMAWRHVVYLGVYSFEAVYELLTRVFGSDDESYDERTGGESALAAFVVDATGHPVPDSVTLSSCASETGQAVRPGRAAVARPIDSYRAGTDHPPDLQRLLSPFVVQPEDARDEFGRSTRPQIDLRALWACRDAVAEATGVAGLFPHAEIRVSSTAVSAAGEGAVTHDFLNSFVVDDLNRVSGQARGQIGAALREYLRPNHEIDTTAREDVRTRLDVVLGATAPAQVPLGRWPSNPEHPLALGQQLAVNNVLRMAGADGAGVFAVNGPPGTGKTTMLRDVVAAVVVERARRLAELAEPREAFTGKRHTWKTGDYTRVVHAWNPTLTGFEMVVTSANNGAVANVTQEIPAKDAIDPSWAARAARLDYFPTVADALLVDDSAPPMAEPPAAAWALIAARLGNKQLRGRFVGDFWYGRRASAHRPADRGRVEPSAAVRPGIPAAAGAAGAPPWPAMLEILRGFETSPQVRTSHRSVSSATLPATPSWPSSRCTSEHVRTRSRIAYTSCPSTRSGPLSG